MAVVCDQVTKLLYIVVVEEEDDDDDTSSTTFRYTRSILQSTLQFMGCKPRHAFKISRRVFKVIGQRSLSGRLVPECEEVSDQDEKVIYHKETEFCIGACLNQANRDNLALQEDKSKKKPFELYKRRTTVVVSRNDFLDVVCGALTEYKYVGPNQRADLVLACRFRERKESVTILLCGTSGCGKSTLSALLGSRLGITTVVSTDSIRHMMRSFVDEKENPLLWASTYHAGEYLDPVAVAEAKAKRKAKKSAGVFAAAPAEYNAKNNSTTGKYEGNSTNSELLSPKQMAVEGYKAQSEMVIDSLDRLITSWEERKESVVVEGVHLSLNFVIGLMKKHPSIMPFMIYISNEEKHLERFAVRAKYMTLDPAKNKYVKYIRNIRTIQEYLCSHADKHLVPKINNTNVDKSVAVIHATVFSCLRRREAGDQLYDPIMNRVTVIEEEYRNQCAANSMSSKGMFQLIQGQDSNRQLMALMNNDGSVAKVWPLDAVDDNGKSIVGPINLQFGHFGISAWPSDNGCTSHASSMDESKGELTDNCSRHFSSCCSSPKGLAKELKEENSVHSTDEEADETPESDSDADFSDGLEQFPEEMEGSVDEESTKSDEEYDDLAMQDTPQNGYATDNDEALNEKTKKDGKNQLKLDSSQRTKSEPLLESLMRAFGFPRENKNENKNETRTPLASSSSNSRSRKRSQSISSLAWITNKWSNKEALPS